MRPQLLKVDGGIGKSFSARRDLVPCINNHWHYHEEVELIYFKKGEGTQFVGDYIAHFNPGDIFLIGHNTPHYARFDDKYFDENAIVKADVIVVHFTETFWGQQFLELPENTAIKKILDNSKRGLHINGKFGCEIAEIMEQLLVADGPKRVMFLIDALNKIHSCDEKISLSSMGFTGAYLRSENDRINTIYNFSLKNFDRAISIHEISAVANMSPNSFCRFFKSRTGKTYSQFLKELRISHAARLLIESNKSMKQVCYDSGFNNFTSFHKFFKTITGKSPLVYQKEFIQL